MDNSELAVLHTTQATGYAYTCHCRLTTREQCIAHVQCVNVCVRLYTTRVFIRNFWKGGQKEGSTWSRRAYTQVCSLEGSGGPPPENLEYQVLRECISHHLKPLCK